VQNSFCGKTGGTYYRVGKMQQLPLKVNIVPSLGIGMISIIMIHLPMAGAIMDRYERGKILQQTLPTEK
jgi:hypothetical protein